MAFGRIWVFLEDHLKLYGDETGNEGPHRLSQAERDMCISQGTPFRIIRESDNQVYVAGMTWPRCERAPSVEEFMRDYGDIIANDEDIEGEDISERMELENASAEFMVCPDYGHNTIQVLIGDTWTSTF
jgi:hypothetical protein